MIKKILPVFAVALLALLAYAATRPDSFRVERKVQIKAPPEKVYALVGDLRQFNRWNPWERKDPGKGKYASDNTGAPGASYAWASDQLGEGRMTLTELAAPARMVMRLDFIKPMQTTSHAEFTLVPVAGGTEVTWAMYGPSPYISKLMGVFFDMDTMLGKDFEDGLANLKSLAEKP